MVFAATLGVILFANIIDRALNECKTDYEPPISESTGGFLMLLAFVLALIK